MQELPEESSEFRRLVDELEQLLAGTREVRDKRAVLSAAARRYDIEHKLIKLLSPAGRPEERRRNVRVPCGLPVMVTAQSEEAAVIVDVSFGGARLSGAPQLKLGQTLQLSIAPQPGLLDLPVITRGKVVWVHEEQTGVFFISEDPGFDRRMLLLVLALLKRKSAG